MEVRVLRPVPVSDLTTTTATALIDTGATVSGIGPRIIDALGLKSHGKKRLKSATEERFVDYFFFRLGLNATEKQTTLPYVFDELEGFSWNRDGDFEIIVGMDVLGRCDLELRRNGRGWLHYG